MSVPKENKAMTTYLIVTSDRRCHEIQANCALGAISKVCSVAKCYSTDIIMLHAKQPNNKKV